MASIKKVLSEFDTSGGRYNELRCPTSHSHRYHPNQHHFRRPAADEVIRVCSDRKQLVQQQHQQLLLPRLQRHRRASEGHRNTVTSSNSSAAGLQKSPSERNEFLKDSQVSVGRKQPTRS
jgi:hypothetical protein